jgi:hypothetical protein
VNKGLLQRRFQLRKGRKRRKYFDETGNGDDNEGGEEEKLVKGFKPATFRSLVQRAIQLRYPGPQ